MKKKKQLAIALGCLVLLTGGLALTSLREKDESPGETEQPQDRESFELTAVTEEDFQSVTISNQHGDYSIALTEKGFIALGQDTVKLDQNMTARSIYSLLNLKSYDKIEENTADYSPYGLENPKGQMVIENKDGSRIIIKVGDSNPSGSSIYALKEGEQTVYLLAGYQAGTILNPLGLFRDRTVPSPNFQDLHRLTVTGEKTIDIVPFFPHEVLSSSMSPLLMIKPYKRPVAVGTQAYSDSLQALSDNLRIIDFIEDDKVTELNLEFKRSIYLKDSEGRELSIQVAGKDQEGNYYCRIEGIGSVVTLPAEALIILDKTPLDMSDRFVRLIGIDHIKGFRVRYGAESWEGTVEYIDEETGVFSFQGQAADEDAFKKMYQEILYLLYEGEVPVAYKVEGEPDFSLEYFGNDDSPGQTSAEFFNYNEDYYAISIDGFDPEFLIGKYQVEALVEYLRNYDA